MTPGQAPSPFGANAARRVADRLRSRLGGATADTAIILGSGLGGLVDDLSDPVVVQYADIPGFPRVTVVGHAGALIMGRLGSRRVICLSGRFHLYEGHAPQLAAFPVRVAQALGARTLVVSNAAGGLRPSLRPGSLMLISDHINMMWRNPLIGIVEPGDERFPDMSSPYDAQLRAAVRAAAAERRVPLEEGVYLALLGPTYETPAEVRMLQRLGADAVGMSTVPEVIVARALGMRVAGISCITNLACGLTPNPLSHEEVLSVAAQVGQRFRSLVATLVAIDDRG